VEQRADGAGGTEPAAALVPDPSVENVVLGAHGDRALLVLAAKKPLAKNPRGVEVRELFLPHGKFASSARRTRNGIGRPSSARSNWLLKRFEPFWPKGLRRRAIDECVRWTTERLNGEDGLGAIYPAMANSVMMYDAMDVPPTIRAAPSPASRWRICSSSRTTKPIASLAFRRCGTRRWSAMR